MKHLILGYGYCGYYLAKELKNRRHKVWTVSRTLKEAYQIDNVLHIKADLEDNFILSEEMNVIHYMISPINKGTTDLLLRTWLKNNKIKTRKIIYYGSSGIYGDHQGAPVSEKSLCHLEFEKQYQRMDAEQRLMAYSIKHNITLGILRISGVLGPNRLPYRKILEGACIIKVSEAPWTNTIYVKDLVNIALAVTQKIRTSTTFNVSDGVPTPLGSTHRLLAILMKINRVYEQSFDEYYQKASPLKQEFLSSSKKISIEKLKKFLGNELGFTDKIDSLKESMEHTFSLQVTS